MNQKQQVASVLAICFTLIFSAAILSYKPESEVAGDNSFKFPSGIPPSLGSFSTTYQGNEALNAIVVSGAGVSSAKADKATVTLGVYTEDESASTAASENAVAMTAVLDAVKALGVSEDDIATVSYSVYPDYDYERKETVGYRVTNMVSIELNDLNIVGDVLDAATNAGANRVNGITFGLSESKIEELKTAAYTEALEVAEAKAELIASTYDITITGVYYVTESSYTPYRNYPMYETASMDGASTPIIEGSLSISVNINAAFTFE